MSRAPTRKLPGFDWMRDSSDGHVGRRLARGTSWVLIGTVSLRALSLLGSAVIARLLGLEDFGKIGIMQSTTGMFATFAGMALGLTATRYVAQERARDPERAGQILGLSLLVSIVSGAAATLVLYLAAPWLAAHSLAAPELAGVLRVTAFMLLLGAVFGVQSGALAGFEAFRDIAVLNAVTGLLSVPVTVMAVWWWGLMGWAGAVLLTSSLQCVLGHVALRRTMSRHAVRLDLSGSLRQRAILWNFSLPAALAGFVVTPAIWLADTILVNLPGGYQQMGILSAANQWRTALMFLPSLILQAVLPIMSEANARADREAFGASIRLSQSAMVLVCLPAGTLMLFLADVLVGIYGPGYAGAAPVLIWVLSGVMIAALGASTGPAIQAQGRMWLGFSFNLSFGVMVVLLTYLLAPAWGARANAVAHSVSYGILTVWGFAVMRHDLPGDLYRRVMWALAYVFALTIGGAVTPAPARAFLALPAAVTTAVVCVAFLVDESTRRALWRRLRRKPS